MNKPDKYDFGGYATRFDRRCTDGRTIRHGAFADSDGAVVPLVWQHGSGDPGNIVGHAILEHRDDGVYAYGVFNGTQNSEVVKSLVHNKAINSLSIYANQLAQVGKDVMSGVIREVSLVMSGANPGAKIDDVGFAHSEGYDDELGEAIIFSGDDDLSLRHSDESDMETEDEHDSVEENEDASMEHAEAVGDKTVGEVLATLNEEQQAAVGFLLDEALSENNADETDVAEHSDKEIEHMDKRNVFDNDADDAVETGSGLTHDDFMAIMEVAKRNGSFHDAFVQHMEDSGYELVHADPVAGTDYGIGNLDYLFPDARALETEPQFYGRRTDWVGNVMGNTKHSPFSRIKSVVADITADEARAKGYITGSQKVEEVFSLLKRSTEPTTVYKKQKLDRDDVLDITDFDVIVWLRKEMRLMLDEELARAILISDGRTAINPDKIKEANIRPIYLDDVLYAHRYDVTGETVGDQIDDVVRGCQYYQGSGAPSFYASRATITEMLLEKDTLGRRLYATRAELAAALGVKEVVEVEPMTGVVHPVTGKRLMGIVVNLTDYTVGADKGGEVNSFDDFDINFNQQVYLLETRISGALTKPKSAIILELPAAVG